ncbi:ANTAR domain-containing protein [Nakamurella flavida]|uniref:ANTAR domain-containing protein n=1 Tax=Nakamurella flavida TaxID=363630 RepID=A0A938YLW1_9ACTN|nr:ANTAR domain-containing protein [Nakamurella flavida]MBM9475300.1 ANTAR domain-containing protein [Nakamurella flavida]MDP9776874.1 hypothetical protein [Nakamurella flavida]
MAIIDSFRGFVEIAQRAPATSGSYLIGSRLAWAAAQVLGGQGAGLSIAAGSYLRWPWGASSEGSAAAERAQFTAGEGPCLTAYARQVAVVADETGIARDWPAFADHLLIRTPFRSVLAVPLRHRLGALDVYSVEATGAGAVDLLAVRMVAEEILVSLLADDVVASLQSDPTAAAPWSERSRVSVAIGMLNVALELGQADALAVLRSHAFGAGRSVDEVAGDLVDGLLTPDDLGR